MCFSSYIPCWAWVDAPSTATSVDGSSKPSLLDEEAVEMVSYQKSYGPCARSECDTSDITGIPRPREKIASFKLGKHSLKLQTASSGKCHELLEIATHKLHAKSVSRRLCETSIQSPCQKCQKMVSTRIQTPHNGKQYPAPKPSCSRGTWCGPCWSLKGGWYVLIFICCADQGDLDSTIEVHTAETVEYNEGVVSEFEVPTFEEWLEFEDWLQYGQDIQFSGLGRDMIFWHAMWWLLICTYETAEDATIGHTGELLTESEGLTFVEWLEYGKDIQLSGLGNDTSFWPAVVWFLELCTCCKADASQH